MDRRSFLLNGSAALFSFWFRGWGSEPKRFQYAQIHMGMKVRILIYAPDEGTASFACREAFRTISRLEDIFSDYRPRSELSRLCSMAGGLPVVVSEDLFRVLKKGQEMAMITDGAFDVTVGPYTRLWRMARRTGQIPSKEALEEARAKVGWRKMVLDPKERTVQLLVPGMSLDLGGIAKGYILDRALEGLKGLGIGIALIEAGGDIVLGDPPPKKDGWLVRIENAEKGKDLLHLSNSAISSSGDTEQYVEFDGARYSHIVDPRTGLGLTNRLAVTVIASECMISDALATAISVLGEEKGMELARSIGVRAYIRRV